MQRQLHLPLPAVATLGFLLTASLSGPSQTAGQEPPKHTNRLAKETSPYLAPRPQPGRLVSLGAGGVREGEGREQADLPLGRLQLVLLVPRHGARVFRRTRRSPKFLNDAFVCIKVDREERPDVDQVYMAAASGVRQRRLADVDVSDARRPAVLRRDVFPARRPRGHGRLPDVLNARRRSLAGPPERGRAATPTGSPALVRRSLAARRAGGACRSPAQFAADGPRSSSPSSSTPSSAASASTPTTPAGPSFPNRSTSSSCSTSTAATDGQAGRRRQGRRRRSTMVADDARPHGPRRHPRPTRRRLSPLLRRAATGSSLISRRCSTTTPSSPGPPLSPSS